MTRYLWCWGAFTLLNIQYYEAIVTYETISPSTPLQAKWQNISSVSAEITSRKHWICAESPYLLHWTWRHCSTTYLRVLIYLLQRGWLFWKKSMRFAKSGVSTHLLCGSVSSTLTDSTRRRHYSQVALISHKMEAKLLHILLFVIRYNAFENIFKSVPL